MYGQWYSSWLNRESKERHLQDILIGNPRKKTHHSTENTEESCAMYYIVVHYSHGNPSVHVDHSLADILVSVL